MRLLELFSGTGSIGRAFEALGWEVTSLDLEGKRTIKCDILESHRVPASPVCCEFSKALTRRPRRLDERATAWCAGRWSSSTTSSPGSGPGKPAERAAHLPGRDLLLLRQPLPQAHQDLGHSALPPAAPVLQGLPLQGLPRRVPPLEGAARQPPSSSST